MAIGSTLGLLLGQRPSKDNVLDQLRTGYVPGKTETQCVRQDCPRSRPGGKDLGVCCLFKESDPRKPWEQFQVKRRKLILSSFMSGWANGAPSHGGHLGDSKSASQSCSGGWEWGMYIPSVDRALL